MASAGRSIGMAFGGKPRFCVSALSLVALCLVLVGAPGPGGSDQAGAQTLGDHANRLICERIASARDDLSDERTWAVGARTATPSNAPLGVVSSPVLGRIFVGGIRVDNIEQSRTPGGKTPALKSMIQVPVFIIGAPTIWGDAASRRISEDLKKVRVTNSAANGTDLQTKVSLIFDDAQLEANVMRANDPVTPYVPVGSDGTPMELEIMLWAMDNATREAVVAAVQNVREPAADTEPPAVSAMALALMPLGFEIDDCANDEPLADPAVAGGDASESYKGLPEASPSPSPRPADFRATVAANQTEPTNRVADGGGAAPTAGSDPGNSDRAEGSDDGGEGNVEADGGRAEGAAEQTVTYVEFTEVERPEKEKAGIMVIVGPAALALKIDGLSVTVQDGGAARRGRLVLDEPTKLKLQKSWRNNPLQFLRVIESDGDLPLNVAAGSDAPKMRLTAADGTHIDLRGERSAPDGATFFSYLISTPEVCALGALSGAACPKPAPAATLPAEAVANAGAADRGIPDEARPPEAASAPATDPNPAVATDPEPEPTEPEPDPPRFSTLDLYLSVEIRGLPARFDYGNYVRACQISLRADLEAGPEHHPMTRVRQDGQFVFRLTQSDVGDLEKWRLLTEEATDALSLLIEDIDDGKAGDCEMKGVRIALTSIASSEDQVDRLVAMAVAPRVGPLLAVVFAYGELTSGDVFALQGQGLPAQNAQMKDAIKDMTKNVWESIQRAGSKSWEALSGIDLIAMQNDPPHVKWTQLFPDHQSSYFRRLALGSVLEGTSGDVVIGSYEAGQPTIANMVETIGKLVMEAENASYKLNAKYKTTKPDVVILVRMKKTMAQACDLENQERDIWAKDATLDKARIKDRRRGLKVVQIVAVDDPEEDIKVAADSIGDVLFVCRIPADSPPSYVEKTLVMSISDRLSSGGWRRFQIELVEEISNLMAGYK